MTDVVDSFDVVIIGAGIGGSCVAIEARERGLSTIVVDIDQVCASRCALAVLRPSWNPSAVSAIEWYRKRNAVQAKTPLVSQAPGTRGPVWVRRNDYYLVDPRAILAQPDVVGTATAWGKGWVDVNTEGGSQRFKARLVVISRPAQPGAVPESFGTTLLSRNATVQGADMKVLWHQPYHSTIAVSFGTFIKLGSSVAGTWAAAEAGGTAMLLRAIQAGMVDEGATWEGVTGPRYAASEPIVSKGQVLLGGFGRVGYSTAPSMAADLLNGWKGIAL